MLIIGMWLAGCQTATPTVSPTTPAPSITAAPAVALPTAAPRQIATRITPTETYTPTPLPTLPAVIPQIARVTITPTRTLTLALPTGDMPDTEVSPYPVPQPGLNDEIIGYSGEGRPIFARRFGSGDRIILLVGGIHGGWEANTVELIAGLMDYFAANPADIDPAVSLIFIPALNPDGLPYGRTAAGRFNMNGADLNRNWGCDWSEEAYWREQRVNPGASPFSEPETQAAARYIEQLQPVVALFYHSAANGVYAGDCAQGFADSDTMAEIYGEAAGYRTGAPFTAYPVNGAASNWVDGLGIASADVELQSWNNPEVERNLRGIMAVMAWVTDR